MSPRDYVSEPRIPLFGCRPHVPFHTKGVERCPVCKGLIGLARRVELPDGPAYREDERDQTTHCHHCDALSPQNEARLSRQRRGVRGRERALEAEAVASRELDRHYDRAKRRADTYGGPILSETERRRLWNGYKGGILRESIDVTDRAKIGRDWLTAKGQVPDWDLILDRSGKAVGRLTRDASGELTGVVCFKPEAAAVAV